MRPPYNLPVRPAAPLCFAVALLLLAVSCLERVDAPLPLNSAGGPPMLWEGADGFGGDAVLAADSPDPWERRFAPGGFVRLGGIDADEGTVWAADLGLARLQAFDYEGRYLRSLGSGTPAAGTLPTDAELAADYASGAGRGRAWENSPAARRWVEDTAGLFLAADLALAPEGLWIADQAKTSLSDKARRAPAARLLRWDGSSTSLGGARQLWPGWVAADGAMVALSEHLANHVTLYTANADTPRHTTINENTATLSKLWDTLSVAAKQPRFSEILDRQTFASSQPGQLRYPGGLALAFGKLLVCDQGNRRIQVFEARRDDQYYWGKLVKVILPRGPDGHLRFEEPLDLDIAEDGTVFLLDRQRNEVAVLSPAFDRLGAIGAGDFGRPVSVACSPDGRHCFVADQSTNRVHHYVRSN